MSPSPSPVVANWELSVRLRELRHGLGLNATQFAKRLHFTHNYWSQIENQRKVISARSLEKIFNTFSFADEDRVLLRNLHAEAKESGWWSQYDRLFDEDIKQFYGLEHGARRISEHETLLIPGLLQTSDYIRTVTGSFATISNAEVEQRVEARLRRQERLHGADPLQLTAIFSEAALRQQIGGINVLRGQLDHLLEVMEQCSDNVEIRVVPFTASAYSLFGAGSLSLMDFPDPLPRVAWYETVSTWGVVTDPDKVNDLSVAYDEAYRTALDQRETKKTVEKYRKEVR